MSQTKHTICKWTNDQQLSSARLPLSSFLRVFSSRRMHHPARLAQQPNNHNSALHYITLHCTPCPAWPRIVMAETVGPAGTLRFLLTPPPVLLRSCPHVSPLSRAWACEAQKRWMGANAMGIAYVYMSVRRLTLRSFGRALSLPGESGRVEEGGRS